MRGALLVRNSSSWALGRVYYGGGTVAASTATESFCALKVNLSERFEDGTLPYLDIVSLRHGFNTLDELAGGMRSVSSHAFLVAQFFARHLMGLVHSNGSPLARVFVHDDFQDPATQGPIVNFVLLRASGEHIGFAEVDKLAQLHDIHLRTGCFCNIGACQLFLGLANHTIRDNLQAGHVCGDDRDLIAGRPTGSIRVSFGYMSTLSDAARCLQFLAECFLDLTPTPRFSAPPWYRLPLNHDLQDASEEEATLTSTSTSASASALPGTGLVQQSPPRVGAASVEDVRCPRMLGKNELHRAEGSWREEVGNSARYARGGTSEEKIRSVEGALLGEEVEGDDGGDAEEKKEEEEVEEEEEEEREGEKCKAEEEMVGERVKCSEKRRVLTDIFLYPVKSCGAFRAEQWELGERGLLYDRTWMIVSESGVALSQKREPRLSLLRPLVHRCSPATLELTFPGMTSYSVPLDMDDVPEDSDVNVCTSKVCSDRVRSRDCGQGVSQWLSTALQRPGLRLLRQLPQDSRQSRRKDLVDHSTTSPTTTTTTTTSGGTLSLANESQYLLISRESVRALAKKVAETQEDLQEDLKDLPNPPQRLSYLDEDNLVARFRANLVIDGGLPFDEDHWTHMACGDIHFIGQGQCSRCGMICLNQSTAEKSREPLRTLASWRGGKVYFGVYMRALASGTGTSPVLKVGSAITFD